MSLKPPTLTTVQLDAAKAPVLGYEHQLFINPEAAVELGTFTIEAAASGTWTPSVSGALTLSSNPQQLLAILQADFNLDATDLVISVTGTNASSGALSGIQGTVEPPSYAQEQRRIFPRSWAQQIGTDEVFKTITSVTITGGANVVGQKFKLFGIPALSGFIQVGCKTNMNFDLKVPMPTAVPCGRNLGAFIKSGEIPVGSFDITTKMLSFGDGLLRYNGVRVTGLVKEVREDKIGTMNTFVAGMVLTVKPSTGEGVEPGTMQGTGLYEDIGVVLADGP